MADNYITKNIIITVNGNTATLDEPLYLYQYDKNIDIYFTIRNFKFDFAKATQEEVNMVDNMNASYATIRVLKPSTVPEEQRKFISDEPIPIVDGKVMFTITEDFIDEIEEIGAYKLQISLWDEERGGKITIPSIPFEVLEPIFPDDYVEDYTPGQIDISRIGMSRITDGTSTETEVSALTLGERQTMSDWYHGQIISSTRMNQMIHDIDAIWEELNNIGASVEINASNVTYNNGTYANVADALDSLLYVALSVSSFSITLNNIVYTSNIIVEMGRTFNAGAILGWNYNKGIFSITSQTLNLPSGSVSLGGVNTYSYNTAIGGEDNVTFKIIGTDGKTSASRSISITHYNKIYWGISSSTTYNSTLINSLSGSALSDSLRRSITVNAGEGQYIYYAFPSRLGTPIFKVGGFEGGFSKVATYSFINTYNYTENYDIYRSTNANLGETTVEIS